MIVNGVGSPNSRIMIVGEAPGEEEARQGKPFVGSAGHTLDGMLNEAGIARSQCYVTNVARERPPNNDISLWYSKNKHAPVEGGPWVHESGLWINEKIQFGLGRLRQEIAAVRPRVIVPVGNISLWALTGKFGIGNWRGSLLQHNDAVVVPTYHPAFVMREWAARACTVLDLRKAKSYESQTSIPWPKYDLVFKPSFSEARARLWSILSRCMTSSSPVWLAADIETWQQCIKCVGIAWSETEALCIPLMRASNAEGYFSLDEEVEIVQLLQSILTHPNARLIWQNGIYDSQYFMRWMRFMPRLDWDTMLAQHVLFPGTPKDLGHLSSLYNPFHVFWKTDHKEATNKEAGSEEALWEYNAKDCVNTFSVFQGQNGVAAKLGLQGQHDFLHAVHWLCLKMSFRGVRPDTDYKTKVSTSLSGEIATRDKYLEEVLGHPINVGSHVQVKKLFYNDFHFKEITNRKTGSVTSNDEALEKLAIREPLVAPIVKVMRELRSLRVFKNTFAEAELSYDERLRSTFSPGGAESFRLSSSTSAFWDGLNLQNIPSGDEEKDDGLALPNMRKVFIPDEDYTWFEFDLDRADLYVVVWESDDEDLRAVLASGEDMHGVNAKDLFKLSCPAQEVKNLHPHYRQLAKVWCHGTNYGGMPRTMAGHCGIPVHQAEQMYRRWFQIHPRIGEWQKRTKAAILATRSVTNKFGFRRFYFDRAEGIFNEALAWVPQSTVAIVILKAWMNVEIDVPEAEPLIQVHDSLAGQFPTNLEGSIESRLIDCCNKVVVPYEKPLTIPASLKLSRKSWGDCQPWKPAKP